MDTSRFIHVATNPDADGMYIALALYSQTFQPTYTGKYNTIKCKKSITFMCMLQLTLKGSNQRIHETIVVYCYQLTCTC